MNNNQKKNLLDKARFEESGFAPKPGDKAFQYAKWSIIVWEAWAKACMTSVLKACQL